MGSTRFAHHKVTHFGGLAVALVLLAVMWFAWGATPAHAQAETGITSPAPGSVIAGDVPIFGTATIDPFQKYELHFKQDPSGDDAFIYFAGGTSPVVGGQLGVWPVSYTHLTLPTSDLV